jgi:hypothetical protein
MEFVSLFLRFDLKFKIKMAERVGFEPIFVNLISFGHSSGPQNLSMVKQFFNKSIRQFLNQTCACFVVAVKVGDLIRNMADDTTYGMPGNSGFIASGDKAVPQAVEIHHGITIALNAGDITITMSGTGGKGIKSSGTYTQGLADGTGPTLVVNTSGSQLGSSSGGGGGRPGGGGWGGSSSTSSSSKGIKVQGAITLRGGTTTVSTKTNGAEGLESKTSITVEGGQHYYACYDDCINSAGAITFAGGATVCYSNGNDAIDSNYGRTGAITIGDGAVFAYTSKGAPEEGFDCDNNSYIQITGKGIGISAGASQGGGGGGWGGWGGSSSSRTISNAAQGYAFVTSSISYQAGRYYTLADASGTNLVTYSFPVAVSSSLGLFTAKGMTKGSSYTIKYSTSEPTDATTAFHGLYIGSTAKGTTSVTSFTAK